MRSDNLCFRDGRAVLVDWNWLSREPTSIRGVAAEPGRGKAARSRAGPVGCGALAAFIAASGLPSSGLPPETAPTVRALQRAQLAVALDWIDREL